jgi:hypothetical protein
VSGTEAERVRERDGERGKIGLKGKKSKGTNAEGGSKAKELNDFTLQDFSSYLFRKTLRTVFEPETFC